MKNKAEIKGIIFDLGGVIVGSFGKEFLKYVSFKLNVSADKADMLAEAIQKGEPPLQRGEVSTIKFWSDVCDSLNIDHPSKEVAEKLWIEPYKQYVNIKKDTLKLIQKLKGKYKLAILSNTIKEHSEINKNRGLFNNFDIVLLSYKEGLRKPEKEFFEAAAKKLNLSFNELLFVDDEMRWVKAARNHGLKAVLFKSAEHLKKEFEKLGIVVN